MGFLLLVYHHQIARQDTGVEHGLTPYPQRKILAVPSAGIEGQVIFNALLRQNRRSRRHRSHNGDSSGRRLYLLRRLRSNGRIRRRLCQCDGPSFSA